MIKSGDIVKLTKLGVRNLSTQHKYQTFDTDKKYKVVFSFFDGKYELLYTDENKYTRFLYPIFPDEIEKIDEPTKEKTIDCICDTTEMSRNGCECGAFQREMKLKETG